MTEECEMSKKNSYTTKSAEYASTEMMRAEIRATQLYGAILRLFDDIVAYDLDYDKSFYLGFDKAIAEIEEKVEFLKDIINLKKELKKKIIEDEGIDISITLLHKLYIFYKNYVEPLEAKK